MNGTVIVLVASVQPKESTWVWSGGSLTQLSFSQLLAMCPLAQHSASLSLSYRVSTIAFLKVDINTKWIEMHDVQSIVLYFTVYNAVFLPKFLRE